MVQISRKGRCAAKFFNYTKTVNLNNWIQDMRCKKMSFKKQKGKDLRVVAVLTTALSRAEDILRQKQRERAVKWAQLRRAINERNVHQDEQDRRKIDELWQSDLNGLANFMSDLKQVKTTVVR
uniref:Protein corethrella appendiculata n=1 Tax=Xenopsylla cheopis TaxID=163159 RepID=A0A6M2DSB4_XENCH